MKSTIRACWIAGVAAAALISWQSVAGEVPPRSEGGQTLEVPKEHLDLGEVYYVTPGEDTQLLCISDAPLQRVAVTCNRVVGYFVTPFEIIAGQPPLLAGALRLPIASLRAGTTQYNDVLRGPAFLNAAEYPEITFRLVRVADVALVSEENVRRRYSLTFAGELTVRDRVLELEVPVRVELIPFTWRTMARNVGELLTVRARLELKLADVGLEKPDRSFGERMADVLNLDLFLMCNTMSPEKNLDPQIKTAHVLRQLRFLTLLRDFGDAEKGYEFGRSFRRDIWDDAQALHRLASAVLTDDAITRRDLRFVLKAARRAAELADSADPVLLSTLARVYFEMGNIQSAIQQLRKASEHLDGAPSPVAAEIRATLERYEKEAEREPE